MGPRTGKQIAVAMTRRDERDFLAFLRTTADVQILALNSRASNAVWLDQFPPRRTQDRLSRSFALWNKAFPWQPELHARSHDTGIRNIAHAPVIEYSRHPFSRAAPNMGRLYWARQMSPALSDGTSNEQFAPWWYEVERWVKTHSHHREGKKDAAVHYLPWAWWRYGKWGLG